MQNTRTSPAAAAAVMAELGLGEATELGEQRVVAAARGEGVCDRRLQLGLVGARQHLDAPNKRTDQLARRGR